MLFRITQNWKSITILLLISITFFSFYNSSFDLTRKIYHIDKLFHFIAYMILTLPSALAKLRYKYLLGLLFFNYSLSIEILQPFVGRNGEILDLVANLFGILTAFLIANFFREKIE